MGARSHFSIDFAVPGRLDYLRAFRANRRDSGRLLLSNSEPGETEAVNGLQLHELSGGGLVGGSVPQAMPDGAMGNMIPHPSRHHSKIPGGDDSAIPERLEQGWNRVQEPILASRVPSTLGRMIESPGAHL
jgi:hypothetical protein